MSDDRARLAHEAYRRVWLGENSEDASKAWRTETDSRERAAWDAVVAACTGADVVQRDPDLVRLVAIVYQEVDAGDYSDQELDRIVVARARSLLAEIDRPAEDAG